MSSPAPTRLHRMNVLKNGLVLGESPRWHDGRLWLCDWGAQEILALDPAGAAEVIARGPAMPFSIDWLPDGRLLMISGREGLLLRREADGTLGTHAELNALAAPPWNELVVDGRGHAYVNNAGFDFPGGAFAPGTIALVRPDGTARQAADGIAFPNGMAITADGATLIVAESYASRLTAFDIAPDGGLSNRRVWAEVEGSAPDGICLDAEGAAWFADVPNRRCVRVREGGEVLQIADADRGCFACVLGGPGRRTLYAVAAEWNGSGATGGQVLAMAAPAAGAGRP